MSQRERAIEKMKANVSGVRLEAIETILEMDRETQQQWADELGLLKPGMTAERIEDQLICRVYWSEAAAEKIVYD